MKNVNILKVNLRKEIFTDVSVVLRKISFAKGKALVEIKSSQFGFCHDSKIMALLFLANATTLTTLMKHYVEYRKILN